MIYAQDEPAKKVYKPIIQYKSVFLNRRAADRYRALASITPGREMFS